MKKPDLFLEEAVLDDFSKSFDSLEMPVSERVFNAVIILVFLLCVIAAWRVFSISLFNGNFYKNRALANMSEITIVPAERGIIFDRFGKPIVENTASFKAILMVDSFLKNNKDSQKFIIDKLNEILGVSPEEFYNWLNSVNLEKQNSIILKRDLSIEEVARIKDAGIKEVDVEKDFSRRYNDIGVFSHILGYVGQVSSDDLKNIPDLAINDLIGKSGLELFYDNELRGKNGEIIDFRNAKNESVDIKTATAQLKGNDLYLTVDSDLQNFFYRRLKSQLDNLGRVGGVGIALIPQNGEILAMVSLPSFDNNKIKPELLTDNSKPLFNRAVSGVYNPGSTIKPLVGIAALSEGIVISSTEVFSPGYLEIPNPYNPEQPSRFLDWRPQGWVDLYSAIARSSNVFFYAVGGGLPVQVSRSGIWKGGGNSNGLGIKKLREYWQKFGLEQKTGIDLPGEKYGFLPDIEEKEKRTGTQWRLGDTYNNVIGQGDIMITPLELVSYISSIANGGKAYQLHLVDKIVSEDKNAVRKISPGVILDNSSLLGQIREVEKGMIDAVQKSYGTSYMLSGLPFGVAAKTGSAQIEANTKTNAFFVGYGPLNLSGDKKQIVILVLVEDAREGSLNAVPVAKDVFEWYYKNRVVIKL